MLIDEQYFRIERWGIADEAHAQELARLPHTSAELLFLSEGAATISGEGFESFRLHRCELAVYPRRGALLAAFAAAPARS